MDQQIQSFNGKLYLDEVQQENVQKSSRKTQKFLTMKNLLQKNLRNKQFNKKTNQTFRKQLILGNNYKNNKNVNNKKQSVQKEEKIQLQDLYQKMISQNQVKELGCSKASNYFFLWEKFLTQTEKVRNKIKSSSMFFISEEDRQAHILQQFMKIQNYLLEQQKVKKEDTIQKINTIQQDVQKLYFQYHQIHEKFIENKIKREKHNLKYKKFIEKMNQSEKQREQSKLSKRNQDKIQKSSSNQTQTKENNILKHFNNLNLSQKEIEKIVQKRNKLREQLDLRIQLKQKMKNQQQKDQLQKIKQKLQSQKNIYTHRINELKQRIQFKEKQLQRYQNQDKKFNEEIKIFLKMLLKNPTYRSDGILWVFTKMIQYRFQPQILDFSDNLGIDEKLFLLNEFQIMKKEQKFQFKPQKIRIKKSSKTQNQPTNRIRVKSLALFKNQQDQIDNSNLNSPPKLKNNLLSFGSKNLIKNEKFNSIRKKSGSLSLMKNCQQFFAQEFQSNAKNVSNQNNSLSKKLINVTNRKKIYDSTKKFLRTWVTNEGWNSTKLLELKKPEQQKISDNFLLSQKYRVKSAYFKVGRPNTKYKEVIKTLYGQKQIQDHTSRRINTSRS